MAPDILLWISLADIAGTQDACTIDKVHYPQSERAALLRISSSMPCISASGSVKAFGDTRFVNLTLTDGYDVTSRAASVSPDIT
jgi:hypothetical protein